MFWSGEPQTDCERALAERRRVGRRVEAQRSGRGGAEVQAEKTSSEPHLAGEKSKPLLERTEAVAKAMPKDRRT